MCQQLHASLHTQEKEGDEIKMPPFHKENTKKNETEEKKKKKNKQ